LNEMLMLLKFKFIENVFFIIVESCVFS
jgi:hypothetical protein